MKRLLIVLALLLSTPPPAQAPLMFRAITGQVLSSLTTVSSTTSGRAIGQFTEYLRALCTADCHFAVMVTPIVQAASVPIFLPGGVPEYFRVGGGQYVIVRADSA